jgi:hypothetical protein
MKISSIGMRMMFATALLMAMLGGCDRRTSTTDQSGSTGTSSPGNSNAAGSSGPGSNATPPAAPVGSAK